MHRKDPSTEPFSACDRSGPTALGSIVGLARAASLVLAAVAALGCGRDAASRDAGVAPRPARCGASDQAPLREADGSTACVRVGARFEARAASWPDEGDAGATATAVRYVRAGADASRADGTRERPFADPVAALASLPAGEGAVVIAAGRYVIPSAMEPRASVLILGAGPSSDGGTVLSAGAATALRASGATARVTLRGVLIEGASASGDGGVAAASLVAEDGASLRAEDVSIVEPGVGVLVSGARFSAAGITVLRAAEHGVLATGGSACDLRDALIRDGRGRGVEARESHLQLHRALIHENADVGVALRGRVAPDPMGGAARCTLDGPSIERGPADCLSLASITCNGVAAVFAQGFVRVVGSRLSLSGTRAVPLMPGGDGLVVRGGASFELDPDVTAMRGGSELVGNARGGVIVQEEGSTLSMRGALVGGNGGPGLFVARFATVTRVEASEFAFNTGVGVAVATSTELRELSGSTIRDTRMGAIFGGDAAIGDGLSASNAALGSVFNNELSGNPRYAGVFVGASGALRDNRGTDNGFTLYPYASPRLSIDATNRVSGRAGTGVPVTAPEPAP